MKQSIIHKSQSGLVSIVVTMVFLSVITLITVSFAFLMRREQRQALDRQLSTQAFYAAESGVNDAVAAINADASAVGDKNTCQDDPFSGADSDLTTNGIIKYSCVLVDQTPDSLEFDPIPINDTKGVKLDAVGSDVISRVEIGWQASSGDSSLYGTNDKFFLPTKEFQDSSPPDTFANHIGMLRASVLPLPATISRANVNAADKTFFLYPTQPGEITNPPNTVVDTISYSGAAGYTAAQANGAFVSGECVATKTPRQCKVTITNLNSGVVYLRLRSIYQPSSVHITAYDSSGKQLSLLGAQAIIDSTGKANDVLRRIQVRVPLQNSYDYPDFVLQSMDDICKRLAVWPGGSSTGCN